MLPSNSNSPNNNASTPPSILSLPPNSNENNDRDKTKFNYHCNSSKQKLELNQNQYQNRSMKGLMNIQPLPFKALPSNSDLEKTRSSDTSLELEDDEEGSVVIKPNEAHIYSGVPMNSGDTPTMRSQYIDPDQPPLPPLKPLPAPPSPKDHDDDEMPTPSVHKGIPMTKSRSLPPEPTSPISPIGQIIANNNHFRGIRSEDLGNDMTQDPMILDIPGERIENGGINESMKRKRTHKRTLSLRDRFSGLVQSASLRKIPSLPFSKSNSDLKAQTGGHRRTQSGKLNVFNDDDSLSTSEEEKEIEPEDSVIALYKSMTADELYAKKLELIRKYREIAHALWSKYVRVGAEYEINIDYTTRKRFAKLMMNKEEW
eukprot:CAMPEP_0201597318 /NCGR_PEP_ID=MMETSP0190_2-20130828/193861_1 /ASSEMBLY_ACC=CAM_ASM_000263 /TAXON_ID=37353 /ORGANISM="Rosalina sp." /LENGTH=370 /DNA_ID=CAMNT_0048058271 /DNA_START=792 /DNA_END=1901 /DNA_ORIENTATION=-